MKSKLEMAHDMAMEIVNLRPELMACQIADRAWEYADAMQAEADKREDKARPEALRVVQQTFINGVEQPRYAPSHKEWQPDWSQAPEWAVAWTCDKNASLWWSEVPEIHGSTWFIDGGVWQCVDAPSFNYQGNWRESLRRRPQ